MFPGPIFRKIQDHSMNIRDHLLCDYLQRGWKVTKLWANFQFSPLKNIAFLHWFHEIHNCSTEPHGGSFTPNLEICCTKFGDLLHQIRGSLATNMEISCTKFGDFLHQIRRSLTSDLKIPCTKFHPHRLRNTESVNYLHFDAWLFMSRRAHNSRLINNSVKKFCTEIHKKATDNIDTASQGDG